VSDLYVKLMRTEAFATSFAQLKSTLYSAPVMRCVNAAASGQVLPGITDVPIRSHNERMWVKQDDTERITVIFSVDFTDPDDVVFGRVFLNVGFTSQSVVTC
jgi:hypothetical protein